MRKGLKLGAVRLGRHRSAIVVLLVVLLATGITAAYDLRTIRKAENEILKTGDYMISASRAVGALEYYDMTTTYDGADIFTAYSELKMNYTALIWKFSDFKLYDIFFPDRAYNLAVEYGTDAQGIESAALAALSQANKAPLQKGKVLVIGGEWLTKYTTAFIAAFDGYSPTVAEETLFGVYAPSDYDAVILDEPCLSTTEESSFKYGNYRRLERALYAGEVGAIFMQGAISPNPYHLDYGLFSMIFPNGFNDTVYDFGYNYTLSTSSSAPSEFENLSSTWDLSDWGAWTFTLTPEMQNQEVIINLEWPTYRRPWNGPYIYGRPVAVSFTYGTGKAVVTGIRSYLVLPREEPLERPPVDWLYESPEYEEFLTASLEHVAQSEQ